MCEKIWERMLDVEKVWQIMLEVEKVWESMPDDKTKLALVT